MQEEYIAWEQRCNNFIESLEEQIRIKRPRCYYYNRWSLVSRDSKVWKMWCVDVSCKRVPDTAQNGARLIWRSKIAYPFAVINSGHIESCQFLEDTREIVLERVRNVIRRHNNIKVNIVFNGEFVAGE